MAPSRAWAPWEQLALHAWPKGTFNRDDADDLPQGPSIHRLLHEGEELLGAKQRRLPGPLPGPQIQCPA